jgi:hypothetical protein
MKVYLVRANLQLIPFLNGRSADGHFDPVRGDYELALTDENNHPLNKISFQVR